MNKDEFGVPYEPYKKPRHFGYVEIKTGDSVYMRRWYIFRCSLFSIRLHHIMRPDWDIWPHDHPWSFLSIILRGGYEEEWCGRTSFSFCNHPRCSPHWGTRNWSYRRFFNYKHWTDLHKIVGFSREEKGSWTLVFTGPERHDWGFMTDKGFKSHKELGVGDLHLDEPE